MKQSHVHARPRSVGVGYKVGAVAAGVVMVATACGSSKSTATSATTAAPAASSPTTGAATGASTKPVKVALILKDFTNPYFVSMEDSAKTDASQSGVTLSVSAGASDGDTATQITAIENAVSAGDQGILITPNGNAVNSAITAARSAGLYVIALDTAPIPPSTVDITFATDNFGAGKLIGQWTAAKLAGKPADIAMLDLFNNQVVSVDVERDTGFLTGMGITVPNSQVNGSEAASGNYSGGTYKVSCHQASQGTQDGGKTAMENCLSKDPNVNVVYAINEPAAEGAVAALQAAGNTKVSVVAIDGGCSNLPYISNGTIAASAGQFPGKMASLGVEAIRKIVQTGQKPTVTPGLNFFNTGTELYTDSPQTGVTSITSQAASSVCWGSAS